jgi:hypothetical protein
MTTRAWWTVVLKALRWLPIVPLFYAAGIACWMVLSWSMLLCPLVVKLGSHAGVAPEIAVTFSKLGSLFIGLCVFVWPIALYAGFLLRRRVAESVRWGFSVALLLLAIFEWSSHRISSPIAGHFASILGSLVVIGGAFLSVRLRKPTFQWSSACAGLLIFTTPIWLAWATTPAQPPAAQTVWSVVPQKGTWQAMNTGSEFAATRQLVFAKDAIVAVFEAASAGYENGQPMSVFRLVSIDLATGKIETVQEFKGHWGAMPNLFATSEGRVAIADSSGLRLLNSNLSPTGRAFQLERGRVVQSFPDGRVLGWEKDPGVAFIDATNLEVTETDHYESLPYSIIPGAVLTSNVNWYGSYPNDKAFVTLEDKHGQRLIFHGQCGSRPQFLSSSRILVIGCGEMKLLDVQGNVVRTQKLGCCYAGVAGVSQNGRRFAIHFSDDFGDPASLLYEEFLIYDSDSLIPIAVVQSEQLPARQSWTAFSADGLYFAAGSPDSVALYKLPRLPE